MAAGSASGASAATAAQLRDEALAAAQCLEREASAARETNAARADQLQQDAALLKDAAAAQERVRAAADALSQARAQADALEAQAAALRERLRSDSDDDGRSTSSEAATLAHLHSQACAVQNVKYLIPIVLDLQSPHYSKWRGYLLLALGRYELKDHVLSDVSHPSDPHWQRMDCVVVSWIFNSISPELLDIIHAHDGVSARAAWLGIAEQFLGNRESRALLLDAEFRNLSQGDLTVDDYCRKMKGMADALADLGEPVNDRTLVLNVLRGLNERFQFMTHIITRQRPFPSFADVRADLRLAELNMAPPSAAPTALLTAAPGKTTPAPSAAPPRLPATTPPTGGSSGTNSGANRGRRRRGGRNQGTLGSTSVPGGQQWPSFYNPWTGSIQMWPNPAPGGLRHSSTRPDAPPPHAMLAGTPPPGFPAAPPSPGAPLLPTPPTWAPWTPQSLAQAFSTVSLNQPSPSDWVFDSGASSHVAANPGIVTPTPSSFPTSIVVGNGATLPVVGTGCSTLPGPFRLNNVLLAPGVIKNLLSVRQFTTDNQVSIEFDPSGFSVKDLRTRNVLLRCDSLGPLYTLQLPSTPGAPCVLVATPSSST